MIYRDLLFDLDHTLLDFNAAEDVALTELLTEAHVDDVETYKEVYIPMNRKLWNDLSLKKITKKELVDTRFSRLFAHFGHEVDGHAFAMRYQDFLSQQGQILPGADKLLVQLNQEGYRIFGATNGITKIQTGRMANSGIKDYFEHVFISDEVGFQKPDKGFYDAISGAISRFNQEKTLMIGDNLLADIQGGNNAGIDTVWYNPDKKINHTAANPSYTVHNYQELLKLLR
ncbi:YjjG family noncanonical pyrimidine nucleotidase [Streptococcus infantarius]|uniref:YjjG family noncanonical pyrimidine nucleotidase n=1 Tax=Streptococcus infantarius TaxID=102684 RepID=UPI00208E29D3|nr:YjjG family noncanonical pyrimidine nucleotidase [Streptococcus infantarius]MCO4485646.1 HAD-superfamily hydrolase/phosphatase [Streptococcus infantarius subsp. infantarius]MCO4496107.1 HAD-superfamily hydrolase/phosphatase [Streptococcus infantarius subsp. infantarius]MCO4500868.1 HAD-superfamily hydrolase/phosphatase [Streptococcus infantarius subsp. infantarius]MCO4503338.1 HAD-superfamily hydrolase/phosphatase [Streptococcus infantarius subsp. infantarius]MCO4505702.1 HAD-superfamily hy